MSRTDDDVEDLPLDSPKAPTATETTAETGETTARTELEGGEEYDEEEEEEEEGEEEEVEEEPVYFTEDFISGPSWPDGSTIPADILVFEYY